MISTALLVIAPLLPLLLLLWLYRDRSFISPPTILLLVVLIGSPLKALYLANADDILLWNEFLFWLPKGSFYLCLATCSFFVGYTMFRSTLGGQLNFRSFPVQHLYFVFIAFSCFLMLAYLAKTDILGELMSGRLIGKKLFLSDDGVETAYGFLSVGAEFSVVIACLALPRKGLSLGWKTLYFGLFMMALLVFLVSTQRTAIVFSALLLFICLRDGVRSLLNFKTCLLAGLVGITILLATSVRTAGRDGVSLSSSSDPVSGLASGLCDQLFTRPYFLTPDKTGRIITNVEANSGYLLGSSIYSFFTAPIPRVLWKEKPPVRIGPHVARTVYAKFDAGIPPGVVAELYLNFGAIGVIAGMALLGILSKAMFTRYMTLGFESVTERGLYGIFLIGFLIVAIIADLNGGLMRFSKFAVAWFICSAYWQSLQAVWSNGPIKEHSSNSRRLMSELQPELPSLISSSVVSKRSYS